MQRNYLRELMDGGLIKVVKLILVGISIQNTWDFIRTPAFVPNQFMLDSVFLILLYEGGMLFWLDQVVKRSANPIRYLISWVAFAACLAAVCVAMLFEMNGSFLWFTHDTIAAYAPMVTSNTFLAMMLLVLTYEAANYDTYLHHVQVKSSGFFGELSTPYHNGQTRVIEARQLQKIDALPAPKNTPVSNALPAPVKIGFFENLRQNLSHLLTPSKATSQANVQQPSGQPLTPPLSPENDGLENDVMDGLGNEEDEVFTGDLTDDFSTDENAGSSEVKTVKNRVLQPLPNNKKKRTNLRKYSDVEELLTRLLDRDANMPDSELARLAGCSIDTVKRYHRETQAVGR